MIKKICVCVMIIAVFMSGITGSAAAASVPSKKPVNIAMTFSRNPTTEKNFNWITKSSELTGTVLEVWQQGGYVTVFNGTEELAQGYSQYFSEQSKLYAESNKTYFVQHKVTATGLKPGTTYYYRCGDRSAENQSDIGSFTTAAESGAFKFIYMTDPQAFSDNDFSLWKRTSEHAAAKYPNAAFVAISGDLVDRGSSVDLWDKFFDYGKSALNRYTVVPAIGNHETDTGPHTFDKHFNFPTNSNKELPDYVYSFNYSNAHFMVLSTEMTYGQLNSKDTEVRNRANSLLDKQIEWLRAEVAENSKKWNVVILHKGLYASGAYYNDDTVLALRNKLTPVFDELSVDAVLQGHDHTFSKAFLYQGSTPADCTNTEVHKTKGTFYLIGNTAGPKFYELSKPSFDNLLKCAQPKKQMYTAVSVSESELRLNSYVVSDGEDTLFDTFTIYK